MYKEAQETFVKFYKEAKMPQMAQLAKYLPHGLAGLGLVGLGGYGAYKALSPETYWDKIKDYASYAGESLSDLGERAMGAGAGAMESLSDLGERAMGAGAGAMEFAKNNPMMMNALAQQLSARQMPQGNAVPGPMIDPLQTPNYMPSPEVMTQPDISDNFQALMNDPYLTAISPTARYM